MLPDLRVPFAAASTVNFVAIDQLLFAKCWESHQSIITSKKCLNYYYFLKFYSPQNDGSLFWFILYIYLLFVCISHSNWIQLERLQRTPNTLDWIKGKIFRITTIQQECHSCLISIKVSYRSLVSICRNANNGSIFKLLYFHKKCKKKVFNLTNKKYE